MINVSEAIAHLFVPFEVGIAHRHETTIKRRIMQPKDRLNREDKSSVIYKINCSNCAAHYIGETSNKLKTRLHEHQLAVPRKDLLPQVAMHSIRQDHRFMFTEAEVSWQVNNQTSRPLQEAWYSNEKSVNRHIDLHLAYQALGHQLKHQ